VRAGRKLPGFLTALPLRLVRLPSGHRLTVEGLRPRCATAMMARVASVDGDEAPRECVVLERAREIRRSDRSDQQGRVRPAALGDASLRTS
jgi:hypothetical protein